MKQLIALIDSKPSNLTFCKVIEDTGFCVSELAVGWIKLNQPCKKGDAIDIPSKYKVEGYEEADNSTGEVWKKLRVTSIEQ